MDGSPKMLYQYMEEATKKFVIPVYQRNYDWQVEQCEQLFNDLIEINRTGAKTHFFGSVVSAADNVEEGREELLIIDGQQRLTTVSLLLLAVRDLLKAKVVKSQNPNLGKEIFETYLTDKDNPYESKLKLKPVKEDAEAYDSLLFHDSGVKASNITINYNYFVDRIKKKKLTPDEIYNSFRKLQIIDIFLNTGEGDNPQLVFENLNATGMELSEGDKIRNYVLMGITPASKQNSYYKVFWHEIEKCTNYKVSDFIRDYLTVKLKSTPAIGKVYQVFKRYFEEAVVTAEDKEKALLTDLLSYARKYEILTKANSDYPELNGVIDRLNRLGFNFTRPFLLEVLLHTEENGNTAKLSPAQVTEVFETVESYVFRRFICGINDNSLYKFFELLHREIVQLDGRLENYPEKFKYILGKNPVVRRFPDDKEFAQALSTRPIYGMKSRFIQYLLERLENFGTEETKDVWQRIEDGTYTIEHIMPQTLQDEWKEALGEDYESIHEEWLHRAANLTLTAYNSEYSNNSFLDKRDRPNGFADSGIRMNQLIARYDKWTLEEIKDRNDRLVERALQIWPLVETDYEPAQITVEYFSLAEEYDVTNRGISKFSFMGKEAKVNNWTEMYLEVLRRLYDENPLYLVELAEDRSEKGLSNFVSNYEVTDDYIPIKPDLYIRTDIKHEVKLDILRRFFEIYGIDEDELVFYLQDKNT
ncbi:MAG TPA: DUF262 domain-containing protein [Clostridiales bacterium]|nr:DUF262 domain-containing protein [Clostridiales bacterium]